MPTPAPDADTAHLLAQRTALHAARLAARDPAEIADLIDRLHAINAALAARGIPPPPATP